MPVPGPSVVPPPLPQVQPTAPVYAPSTYVLCFIPGEGRVLWMPRFRSFSHVDCTGKKDGYYSNGCSPEFVFCNEGVPTTMVTIIIRFGKAYRIAKSSNPEMSTNIGIQPEERTLRLCGELFCRSDTVDSTCAEASSSCFYATFTIVCTSLQLLAS